MFYVNNANYMSSFFFFLQRKFRNISFFSNRHVRQRDDNKGNFASSREAWYGRFWWIRLLLHRDDHEVKIIHWLFLLQYIITCMFVERIRMNKTKLYQARIFIADFLGFTFRRELRKKYIFSSIFFFAHKFHWECDFGKESYE